MRSQEFAATAAIALAVAGLGFTIAAGLSALASGESLSAGAAAPGLTKPIYCPDGENRQFSNIHHAWVCRTGLAAEKMKISAGQHSTPTKGVAAVEPPAFHTVIRKFGRKVPGGALSDVSAYSTSRDDRERAR